LNVASGEKHEVKGGSMKLSQNNCRSCLLKTDQNVSPRLQEVSDSHGVDKYVSPVKVTSRRKTAPSTSFNAGHTLAAAKSEESGSQFQYNTGYKRRLFVSRTPAFKRSASTVKSRDAGGVGSSSEATALGLSTISGSPAQKDYEVVSSSGPFLVKQVSSQRISNYVDNLSSKLHEEDPDSSGSRCLEALYMPRSSGNYVHRLSRSETSLSSISTPKSPRSPKNDLRDVRDVRRLITSKNVSILYRDSVRNAQ
jgi:hypothetical protein